MKKLLLSSIAALSIFSTTAMAIDAGGGNWFYSPKRYITPYVFSIDLAVQKVNSTDMYLEAGLSSKYIKYIGTSYFNYGVLGNLELTKLKKDDFSVWRLNLDVGPTIGYNLTNKTDVYGIIGYSLYGMMDKDKTKQIGGTPFYGVGVSHLITESALVTLEYKVKKLNKDNPWGFSENHSQISLGVRVPFH